MSWNAVPWPIWSPGRNGSARKPSGGCSISLPGIPTGPTSFFAYDEPPMWMMMRGTRAYDWTYDLFTPDERAADRGQHESPGRASS